ncbi:multiple epidermal growth factor-like domains protein 10 [Paramacrobiotus metropolitanus]|uniref:multiple epidermal growth factor-like domains protein 10 n=1 Tax=Paramacrobiotus metropolitanus TaxID=2943436 RepID=UPI002446094B|nr:multiple epidermal growth factor-like domains protein 10 [Paramacrobiotus metropolitanus]
MNYLGYCVFLCCLELVFGEPAADSQHVCEYQEKIEVNEVGSRVYASEPKNVTQCEGFRCINYTKEFSAHFSRRIRTKTTIRMKKSCCSGFVEDRAGYCAPRCLEVCDDGYLLCVGFNGCECSPGFIPSVTTCDTYHCPKNRFGKRCQYRSILCQNNGTCMGNRCICRPGWTGDFCNITCPHGSYGQDCGDTCWCHNGAPCHPVSGECLCTAGFCGAHCERPCSRSTKQTVYGRCQNGGYCREGEQKCTCSPGLTGDVCANRCDSGFYGENCQQVCPDCGENARCDAVTGKCKCLPGQFGQHCEKQCPPGRYGHMCGRQCACMNGAHCSPADGTCECRDGYFGQYCEIRRCRDSTFGPNCENSCSCSSLTECDSYYGDCTCRQDALKIGGQACLACCVLQGGLRGCYEMCNTSDQWICAPELGGCHPVFLSNGTVSDTSTSRTFSPTAETAVLTNELPPNWGTEPLKSSYANQACEPVRTYIGYIHNTVCFLAGLCVGVLFWVIVFLLCGKGKNEKRCSARLRTRTEASDFGVQYDFFTARPNGPLPLVPVPCSSTDNVEIPCVHNEIVEASPVSQRVAQQSGALALCGRFNHGFDNECYWIADLVPPGKSNPDEEYPAPSGS